MRLAWRAVPAAHQPFGRMWELIDAELDFHINQWGQAPVHAMLSPTYAYIYRTAKRRYEASLNAPYGAPTVNKAFDSLTKAKTWAQALVALDPPSPPTE